MARGSSASEPSQRQLRVAEQIRHLLAEDLMRGEIHDTRLAGRSITVGEVRVSRDLRHATVFASELGGRLQPAALLALEQAGARLGARMARRMNLKYAPRLHFVADDLFDEAARMERLLSNERARLQQDDDEETDGTQE
ncbi:30S ribosome-binding factor RbfA [Rhodospirillales bacterium YIM 152171]|uniref:Ribosome-binding factor A n=1 Tax=Marinimicrococcus flavescens TaxID=3031815 RepID=A0AAP3UYD2_9PROT|nr:30S ribosome-binding factor RbfA [Marinimicrococcus flavescens]